jgi:chitodextrinase
MKRLLQKQKALDYTRAGEGLVLAATRYERVKKAKRVLSLGLAGLAFIAGAFTITGQETVKAAACAAPTADLGTDTLTINVPEDGQYTIWTRMVAPDTTNNSINLQIDQNDCYNIGGGAFVAPTWENTSKNWVNYANGATTPPVSMQFAKGTHTLKYIGTKPGVLVDKVIVTANNTLTPTGVCDDCLSGDSTPPTVNMTPLPTPNNVLGPVTLQVTSADASGIAKVDFLIDGQVIYTDTTAPYSFDWNSASVQNGAHELKAQSTDTEGNTATSAAMTITTNNLVVCTQNPAVPANLRVSGTTGNSVSLAWDASVPGAQCQMKNYRVFRDGVQVSTSQGTTFVDTGLAPGGTHSYTVAGVDLSDHVSGQSTAVTGTTANDNQAPTVPADLRASLTTASSVALVWAASTDNNGVASYVVYRNGTQVGTSTTTSYSDGSVEPNKDYSYTVAAKDTAGNVSGQSQAIAAKTLDGQPANPNKMYITPVNVTLNKAAVSQFTVEVRVNTNGDKINTVGARVSFSNLEFVGSDVTTSSFDLGAIDKVENGVIMIDRASLNSGTQGIGGDNLVAKLTFKLVNTGPAKIDVLDDSIALSATTNSDVLAARDDGNYTIVDQPASTGGGGGDDSGSDSGAGSGGSSSSSGSGGSGSSGGGSGSGSSGGSSDSSSTPTGTTTIAPEGSSDPVVLPNDAEVELSDPVVVQTTPDSSQTTEKVEYYLNGKLIATVKDAPYTYTVNTKNMKNGKYTLTTKTYYSDGQIETKNATLVVKNPLSFRQVMLQIGSFIWIIILLLVLAAGAVWYFFFRNRGGGDDYSGDDGYMFGPNGQVGGPPGDNFGPPAQYSVLLSQFKPIMVYEPVSLQRY